MATFASVPFPLPKAPQQNYTKWFNHVIKAPEYLKNYTILWVGTQLPCRFKSETISEVIGPPHVFICKKNDDFQYITIDNTELISKLPKKYHTSCFPGIQYSSVPKNNRVKIQLTNKTEVELPFIPPSFLQQKKLKTSRAKRKRTSSVDNCNNTSYVEKIDFQSKCPSWHILFNEQVKDMPMKQMLLMLMRSLITFADNNKDFSLEDPFANVKKAEDMKNESMVKNIKVITSFIYHHCRSEFGCSTTNAQIPTNELRWWTECLNNEVKE